MIPEKLITMEGHSAFCNAPWMTATDDLRAVLRDYMKMQVQRFGRGETDTERYQSFARLMTDHIKGGLSWQTVRALVKGDGNLTVEHLGALAAMQGRAMGAVLAELAQIAMDAASQPRPVLPLDRDLADEPEEPSGSSSKASSDDVVAPPRSPSKPASRPPRSHR